MAWPTLSGESEAFVDDLLRHMTFAEKVGQLDIVHRPDDPGLAAATAMGGVGGVAGTELPARLQAVAAERSRLGIPLLLIDESPDFPLPPAVLAASWDEEIASHAGHALAQATIARGFNAVVVRCGLGTAGRQSTHPPLVPVCDPHLAARLVSALASGARNVDRPGAGDVMIIPRWVGEESFEQGRWARALAANDATLALDAAAFSRRAATQAGFGGLLAGECRRLFAIIAERFRSTSTRSLAEAAERAIDDGVLGIHDLEGAVRGVIAAKHALGLFRNPDRALVTGVSSAHPLAPGEVRRRGMVLLRNEAGLLPLSPISDRVLVVGPVDGAAATVAEALSRSGIAFSRAPGLAVRLAGNSWETELPGDGFAFSLTRDAAQRADFVLLALDDRHFGVARESALPQPHPPVMALVRALGSSGSRLACILMTAGPVDLGDADQHLAGVLHCGPVGAGLDEALADVLAGRGGPCGRLSLPVGRHSFGQGLGFAECVYSGLRAEARDGGIVAAIRIRNAGTFPTQETVQLYLTGPGEDAPRLADFATLSLAPGEELPITFHLGADELGQIAPSGERSLAAGRYGIAIGKHRQRLLTAEIELGERQARSLANGASGLRLATR